MLALKTENHYFTSKTVALIFKDKGGLANHLLSFHPQGVFDSRENERKAKKMRERKGEENSRPVLCISNAKK